MKIEEIAKEALRRFLNGKGRCIRNDGCACVYENEDGTNNCIVGHFLPNGHPAKSPEQTGALATLVQMYEPDDEFPLPQFIYDHEDFFIDLQCIHDSSKSWDAGSFSFEGFLDFVKVLKKHGMNPSKIMKEAIENPSMFETKATD